VEQDGKFLTILGCDCLVVGSYVPIINDLCSGSDADGRNVGYKVVEV